MARSIEPIKTGGYPSFPLSPSEGHPYNSRVESEVVFEGGQGTKPKNYQFVAFRPGFPLQASELNEIQEHFQLQLTLSIAMMNNWITSGAGPLWDGADEDFPGDGEGGRFESFEYNTSIGQGGSNSGGGHSQMYAISGPGWRGSTPLHPYESPYSGSNTDRPVTVELLPEKLKLTFNSGWWLVELPNPNTGSVATGISGLKHWIYIDSSWSSGVPDLAFQIEIPFSSYPDVEIPVGFVLESDYKICCSDSNDPLVICDPGLGDNAAGFANPAACGASRYAVNAVGVKSVNKVYWPANAQDDWSNAGQSEYNQISMVCKVNMAKKTIRYMNNMILFTW